jgi:hypothetical protein
MKDAEAFHILEAHGVTAEVQPGVDEHGAVTCGEDEAVAIQPFRVSGVALERFAKKDSADVGGTEWQAEVAGGALVDSIHGETTGFIGSLSEEGFVHERGEMSQEYVNGSKKRQKRPGVGGAS